MRAPLALMLIVCAFAGACCATSDAPAEATKPGRVVVPNLKGKTRRDALCQLQRLGLRWRFRGGRQVESQPPSGCGDNGIGGSLDDIPVTGQAPRPGARVRRGAVITLDDMCTDAAREGKGCA
jgi:beta-lactam-binding protein with PASTA domain